MKMIFAFLSFFLFVFCQQNDAQNNISVEKPPIVEVLEQNKSKNNVYTWKEDYSIENKLQNRIAAPKGFNRTVVAEDSYADWLRNLPLKEGKPTVMLFNGNPKGNQNAHFAVLDIDVGKRDLQQCADAVMRLRAEYLFSSNQKDAISFNFTSGDKCSYADWQKGIRPIINQNKVSFKKTQNEDASYQNFKSYLNIIFSYCGTHSLEKELKPVTDINDIKAGDVFIMGGFPGHAVTVLDVAENATTKEKLFLLAQSYMPAQDMHVLKNPRNNDLSPWFSVNFDETLITPEWTFKMTDLKRF